MENYIKVIKLQEKRVKYGNGKLWQKQSHPMFKETKLMKKNSFTFKETKWMAIQKKSAMYK